MLRLIRRRLTSAIPTLFAIVTLAFFMVRLAPGGPFDAERRVPPEIQANLDRVYHLDESLPRQYLRYLGDLAHGDLGPSFTYKDFTVSELIGYGFPVSFALGASALLIAVVFGLLLGAVAALRKGSWLDHLVMTFAMVGIAVPSFVTAPLLALVFGVWLVWLPAGGWGDGEGSVLGYAVLPVAALALPQIAVIARLMRGSLIEVMRQPYIRTARAKRLPEWRIVLRHAARPALLPVVSYLGPAFAGIVTGSVVVEQIFAIPGIGRYFVQGALNRDYTLVTGVVEVYGVLIILANLAVDIAYGLLDPRQREMVE
jgi:oligopeptide transport system permease protein